MSENKFIDTIITNLENNGFPAKRVSLPLEQMYEVADNKGLNFNKVLERLQQEKKINHIKTAEKIIFFQEQVNPFAGMDKENIQNTIQQMMSQMTPEQMTELQETYNKMSPEEREEILKRGKDMGLV